MVEVAAGTAHLIVKEVHALTAGFAALIAGSLGGPTLVATPGGPFFWLTVGITAYWCAKPRRARIAV